MLSFKRLSVGWMAAALLALGVGSAWSAPPRQANWDPALAPYLSKLQAQSEPEFIDIMKALATPEMIAKLVQQYEMGGDLTNVAYALHGLAVYASRPGGEADRRMFSAALVAELPKVKPATRGFLIRQLQAAGAVEAASAIGAYLLEPENSEYAAQALVALGGDTAAEAVRAALPKAEGKMRATLAEAAGSLRDVKAVPLLTPLATDKDRDVPAVRPAGAGEHRRCRIGGPAAQGRHVGEQLRRGGVPRCRGQVGGALRGGEGHRHRGSDLQDAVGLA